MFHLKHRKVNLIASLLLITAMLLGTIPALAQEQVVTVQVNGLFVYEQPSTGSTLVAVMSLGSAITVLADEQQNGFSRVRLSTGQLGWAQLSTSGVPGAGTTTDTTTTTTDDSTGTTSNTVIRAVGNVKIRDTPSLNGTRVGMVPWGGEAFLLGMDASGDWYRINYNGLIGWSSSVWYRVIQGSTSTIVQTDGSTSTDGSTTASGNVQARGNVRLRDAPSLNGRQVGLAPWGAVATLLGFDTTGDWIRVDYNGLIAWSAATWWANLAGGAAGATSSTSSASTSGQGGAIAPDSSSASTTDSSSSSSSTSTAVDSISAAPTGVMAQALGNLRLRDAASLNGARVGSMDWGTTVEILGRSSDGNWYFVQIKALPDGTAVADGQRGFAASAWFNIQTGDVTSIPTIQ